MLRVYMKNYVKEKNIMEYYVTYKVEARYIATVEADSTEEALELATSEFSDADFGAASDIDGEPIIAEDEKGKLVWKKD